MQTGLWDESSSSGSRSRGNCHSRLPTSVDGNRAEGQNVYRLPGSTRGVCLPPGGRQLRPRGPLSGRQSRANGRQAVRPEAEEWGGRHPPPHRPRPPRRAWPEPGLTAAACAPGCCFQPHLGLAHPRHARHSEPAPWPGGSRTAAPHSGCGTGPPPISTGPAGRAAPGARRRPRRGPGGRGGGRGRARDRGAAAPSRRPPRPPPSSGALSRAGGTDSGAPVPARTGPTCRDPGSRPRPPRHPAHRVPSSRRRPGLRAPWSLGAPGAGRPHGAHTRWLRAWRLPRPHPPRRARAPAPGGVWPRAGAVAVAVPRGRRSAALAPSAHSTPRAPPAPTSGADVRAGRAP